MRKPWRIVFLFLVALLSPMVMGTAAAATLADVQQEAVRGGYRLINSDELRDMLNRHPAGVVLVDTRQEWEYAAGHISGAVNFPMEPTWLARLTKRGELQQFLGQDREKHIVFY
ncbi:MAG: rhodanese-like domain-containing protein [Deltaproteobacteria bacterium]|nr:rhodanese-like domain-containing protein [Deltaproteobacteria bacterium]